MKATPRNETASRKASETFRPEYRFDYTKARPNRFAGRGISKSVVLFDPDVAELTPVPLKRKSRSK